MQEYTYDVAISCLSTDEAQGQRLHDLLAPRVGDVFFYTERQGEVVATEGLEAFREPFRWQSRVVVVLFREGWGTTNWTRVEETAIKEMCLEGGWNRIVLYSLDATAPRWLPDTHIWGREQERWGLEGLAAVVERKVKEQGGTIGEEDPISAASRVSRAIERDHERTRRLRSSEAVRAVKSELATVTLRLEELARESTSEAMSVQSVSGPEGAHTALQTDHAAVFFTWEGAASNSVEGSELNLREDIRTSHRPGAGPQSRSFAKFEPEPDGDRWFWRDATNREANCRYSSSEVADEMARHLFEEHLHRKRRGPW